MPAHKIYTDEVLDALAISLWLWVDEGRKKDEVRYLMDWALDNDFSEKNFTRHAAKHEGFKQAYERAKAWQENQIVKNALSKKFDSGFSQFLLQCRFGWKKQEDTDTKANKAKSQLEKISDILHGNETEGDYIE